MLGSEKSPIYIDYRALHSLPIKRLLILKSLIKLINTRDNLIHYEDLGLESEDAAILKKILLENYSDHFQPKKKIIHLFENYNGKIICGIDCLLDDIFELLKNKKIDGANDSSIKDAQDNPGVSKGSKVDNFGERNRLYTDHDDRLDSAFNWIFQDYSERGVVRQEMQIRLQGIYLIDEDKVKEYFNNTRIFSELVKIYKDDTTSEITKKLIQIRAKLVFCFVDFMRNFSDKSYWSELKKESEKMISNIEYVLPQLKRGGLKLFLILQGDPDKNHGNNVISYLNSKVVLFEKASPLYRKLQPQQIILADLRMENPTSYVFTPKKILTNVDALQMIDLGIETYPSKGDILEFLEGGSI